MGAGESDVLHEKNDFSVVRQRKTVVRQQSHKISIASCNDPFK
jgi:hypothetical protein